MPPGTQPFDSADFRQQLQKELTGNILPFWMTHVVDKVNGGFYGAVTNDLQVHNEVPRSAVLCARILWTFATAYRRLGTESYLSTARWAYDYLTRVFWDQEHGGVYWQVDHTGKPVLDHKHHYAQAFTIYGLTEYYRATQEAQSLALAQRLFALLEEHAYEPTHGGYIESCSRTWEPFATMHFGDHEPQYRKSMNTSLHILEAYTNLLQVWDDGSLKAQHRALLEIFLEHIVDLATGHFRLFFDGRWHSFSDDVSYGHDIEGSWLLLEAAEVQGDAALTARVREVALKMATAVYREGVDSDGSLLYEGGPHGVTNAAKHWWPQAEAVVGFYNAYQISGQASFAEAAYRCWTYILTRMVDRQYGDWYKLLSPDGTPDTMAYKVSPWNCPYHHSRVCFEMLERLGE